MGFAGLRIGLVGPLPPPAGGMANQTRQLAELLRKERAQVWLVQTNAAYRPAFIGRVTGLRALVRLLPYLRELWRAAGRSDVFHVMANSGWSWHLFAAPAIWIARLRGVPVVVNYRGGEAAQFLARSAAAVRWTIGHAVTIAVPSGYLQQIFGRHDMSAEVLPNVVDLDLFHADDTHRDTTPHLVVARNLEAIYDNETALRAFRLVRQRCPGARLSIAGSGPEELRLRQLVGELQLGDSVRFTGRLDRCAMAALYREAHVSLNPSRVDNTPNAVLESMASGVPVVSTNVGGVPSIVRNEATALLVEPGNAEAMAAATLRLLNDRALWQKLRDKGLAEVRRYSWPRVSPVLLATYQRAVASPSQRLV